ncbi:MAG: apolipoprotein N-acyltransferase [Alphaproteobacteria bacterium]|nr:apolipoprotein N-acyltransferase [Alphaproteobacteria bacterium]
MRKFPLSRYALAMAAGLVASLALPPIGLTLGLFALSIPALMVMRRDDTPHPTIRDVFLLGWATGGGWFVVSLYWISNALVTSGGWHLLLVPLAGLGLPLFLGLFWGGGFALAHALTGALRLGPVPAVVMLAASLSAAEYLRGHVLTGFPWNAPGLVAASHDLGLAASSLIGYWGMGLVALIFGMLPALLICGDRYRSARLWGGAMLAAMAGLLVAAHMHLSSAAVNSSASGMMVRLVQPNIAQMEKWQRDRRPGHLAALVAASRRPVTAPLDLIVWPETAFAGSYDREPGVLTAITQAASSGSTPVLTGVLRVENDPFALFNAMMVMAPDGEVLGSASKAHLVPFGEYAPMRDYIPFADAIAGPYDFSPGEAGVALTITRQDGRVIRILPLICYEIIFPGAVRRNFDRAEAEVMVVITNDAWFGNSIGPRQHLAMAQMRAAEMGRPVVRVANTGISAMINSSGMITHRIEYGTAGVADAFIGGTKATYYHRFGDRIYLGMLVMVILAAALHPRLTRYMGRE